MLLYMIYLQQKKISYMQLPSENHGIHKWSEGQTKPAISLFPTQYRDPQWSKLITANRRENCETDSVLYPAGEK